MHKTAFVVLAALSLSACASLTPMDAFTPVAPTYAKVDAVPLADTDSGTSEPIVVTDRGAGASSEVVAMSMSPALARRAFGPPSRRQPDLRLVLATATDRLRFQRRRRRARRRA